MSSNCGNCDCADKTNCVKKGNSFGIEIIETKRRRIRDELANQKAGNFNLTNKLDRAIHSLRAQLEAGKYDVIKYCIGSLVSISAVGLAVIRILM